MFNINHSAQNTVGVFAVGINAVGFNLRDLHWNRFREPLCQWMIGTTEVMNSATNTQLAISKSQNWSRMSGSWQFWSQLPDILFLIYVYEAHPRQFFEPLQVNADNLLQPASVAQKYFENIALQKLQNVFIFMLKLNWKNVIIKTLSQFSFSHLIINCIIAYLTIAYLPKRKQCVPVIVSR